MKRDLVKLVGAIGICIAANSTYVSDAQAETRTNYFTWSKNSEESVTEYSMRFNKDGGEWEPLITVMQDDVCGRDICLTPTVEDIELGSTYAYEIRAEEGPDGFFSDFTGGIPPVYMVAGPISLDKAVTLFNKAPSETLLSETTYFHEGFIVRTPDNKVSVNGTSYSLSERGYFSADIPLHEGVNTIVTEYANPDGTTSTATKIITRDILGPSVALTPSRNIGGVSTVYSNEPFFEFSIAASDTSSVTSLKLEELVGDGIYDIVDLMPLATENPDSTNYLIEAYWNQWSPGETNFTITAENEYGHISSSPCAVVIDEQEPFAEYSINYEGLEPNQAQLSVTADDDRGLSRVTISCEGYEERTIYDTSNLETPPLYVNAVTQSFPLYSGINDCTVRTYDLAGNWTEKEIKIYNINTTSSDTNDDGDVDGLDVAETANILNTLSEENKTKAIEYISENFGTVE